MRDTNTGTCDRSFLLEIRCLSHLLWPYLLTYMRVLNLGLMRQTSPGDFYDLLNFAPTHWEGSCRIVFLPHEVNLV